MMALDEGVVVSANRLGLEIATVYTWRIIEGNENGMMVYLLFHF